MTVPVARSQPKANAFFPQLPLMLRDDCVFNWAQDRLASNHRPEVGIVPAAPVGLLEEHCLRRADHARILWALLVMAEWLDWRKTL